ncbi:uncharacterized protein LOC144152773 isoform X3 [Haemaphysalis longicornis]
MTTQVHFNPGALPPAGAQPGAVVRGPRDARVRPGDLPAHLPQRRGADGGGAGERRRTHDDPHAAGRGPLDGRRRPLRGVLLRMRRGATREPLPPAALLVHPDRAHHRQRRLRRPRHHRAGYFHCSEINMSYERCSVPASCCKANESSEGLENFYCGRNVLNMSDHEAWYLVNVESCADAANRFIKENALVIGGGSLAIVIVLGFLDMITNTVIDEINVILDIYKSVENALRRR